MAIGKLPGSGIQNNTIVISSIVNQVTQIISGDPRIVSVAYQSPYTAANIGGGETITVVGNNFFTGADVVLNGNSAPSVSVINANCLTFTTPSVTSSGKYPMYVINSDGGSAVYPNFFYSGTPTWVTTSPLTSFGNSSPVSIQLSATSDSSVTYSLAGGSSLPTGLSLAANGLISGTLTSPPASDTTYSFSVVATDAESQTTTKAFSVTALAPILVDYVVAAGGGGGGGGGPSNNNGGGGGAGGFRTGTGLSVYRNTVYTVTVGGGGTAGTAPAVGTNGSNSVFSTITSTGGGRGGGGSGGLYTAATGGSGGGGGISTGAGSNVGYAGNTPSTSPAQGFAGGSGGDVADGNGGLPNYWGGGGGGASQAGNAARQGTGGNGTASTYSGASVTYAGGGGAASDWGPGNGGSGGGGAGGVGTGGGVGYTGIAGTANLGGGGGGGSSQGGCAAGAGGSGVVIIRYANTISNVASVTGTYTYTDTGGYRIFKFTGSGSITF